MACISKAEKRGARPRGSTGVGGARRGRKREYATDEGRKKAAAERACQRHAQKRQKTNWAAGAPDGAGELALVARDPARSSEGDALVLAEFDRDMDETDFDVFSRGSNWSSSRGSRDCSL